MRQSAFMKIADLIPLALAAEQLGVSVRWLQLQAKLGRINRYKEGKRTLLSRQELENLVRRE